MSEVLLPTVFLLDSDGQSLWGHVRVRTENNIVAQVEMALASKDANAALLWKPFCSLTIVEGRVAFLIHGHERRGTIDASGRVASDGHVSDASAAETRRGLHIASSPENERTAEEIRHSPDLRSGPLGEDPSDPDGEAPSDSGE